MDFRGDSMTQMVTKYLDAVESGADSALGRAFPAAGHRRRRGGARGPQQGALVVQPRLVRAGVDEPVVPEGDARHHVAARGRRLEVEPRAPALAQDQVVVHRDVADAAAHLAADRERVGAQPRVPHCTV